MAGNKVYPSGLFRLFDKPYDWGGDAEDLFVILIDIGGGGFAEGNDLVSEVLSSHGGSGANVEANDGGGGSGYTAGAVGSRKAIASGARTVVRNEGASPDEINLKVADGTVVWTAPGIDVPNTQHVIVCHENAADQGSANDGTNIPLAFFDTGTGFPINTNGGDVTLNFSADGLIKAV